MRAHPERQHIQAMIDRAESLQRACVDAYAQDDSNRFWSAHKDFLTLAWQINAALSEERAAMRGQVS
jgi:hypothetical protein